MDYVTWAAFAGLGATIDEYEKLEQGGYSSRFLSRVVAFYTLKNLIEAHQSEDASRRAKRKR